MKTRNQILGLIAIAIIAIAIIGCKDGDNNNPETFTVTVGTLSNGTITANPTSGIQGTEITLTVNPDDFYRLKSGTLKYGSTPINELTKKFNLPASNVTVTAVFELKFIGSWEFTGGTITFTENTYLIQYSNSSNSVQGTWHTESPNKIIQIGSTTEKFEFEFTSDSQYKLTKWWSDGPNGTGQQWQDVEIIFTRK